MSFFDWFSGDNVDTATIDQGTQQEALGRDIVERAIYDQSRADLVAANQHAADSFEAFYEDATIGPAYDPLADDSYHGLTQETLGRAIVQQAQGQHAKDDSPLAFINSANIGAVARAASAVGNLLTPEESAVPISGVPRQVFGNRPGQGQGWQLSPTRLGNRSGQSLGSLPPVVLIGVALAVGVYLVRK